MWSQHVDELRQLIAEGKGVRDIGRHFGAKEDAVSKALRKLGLKIDQQALLERKRSAMRRVLCEHRESHRASMQTQQYKRKRSIIAKRLWLNEDYAKRRTESWKKTCDTPGWREKHRKAQLEGIARWHEKLKAEKNAKLNEQAMLEKMTPFERQLWLVRNGKAAVTVNFNRRYK